MARKRGRQTVYTQEIADTIIDGLAEGLTINRICARDPDLPSAITVRRWVAEPDEVLRPGFANRYLRARRLMEMAIEDEIRDIADDTERDVLERHVIDGKKTRSERVSNHAAVSRADLQIRARTWLLAKLNPQRYGARVDVGAQAGNPLYTLLERVGSLLPHAAADLDVQQRAITGRGEADVMAGED